MIKNCILCLPWAPSANTIWRSLKGNFKPYRSAEYTRFIKNVKTLYIAQGAPKFEPKTLLQVTIHLFPPHNRSYDVDNRIKPTLDSLTHCGLWSDDRYIRRLTVTAGRPIQDGAIIVEVERFDEDKERENENTVLSWYGLKALSTPKKKKEAKNEQH